MVFSGAIDPLLLTHPGFHSAQSPPRTDSPLLFKVPRHSLGPGFWTGMWEWGSGEVETLAPQPLQMPRLLPTPISSSQLQAHLYSFPSSAQPILPSKGGGHPCLFTSSSTLPHFNKEWKAPSTREAVADWTGMPAPGCSLPNPASVCLAAVCCLSPPSLTSSLMCCFHSWLNGNSYGGWGEALFSGVLDGLKALHPHTPPTLCSLLPVLVHSPSCFSGVLTHLWFVILKCPLHKPSLS